MANLNSVFLIGRLTADPELKYTPQGTAVANMSLAINETWTDAKGDKHERTTFLNIIAWGKQAENSREYLTKGSQIFVDGRIDVRSWEDKRGGGMRKVYEVVAQRIQFLDRKPKMSPAPVEPVKNDGEDDDVPF